MSQEMEKKKKKVNIKDLKTGQQKLYKWNIMRKEWEKNRGSKGHEMISNKNLKVIFGTQEEE